MNLQKIVTFGAFRLDGVEKTLSRDNQRIPLTPKGFDLLCFLVMRPGKLVTKEEIFAGVWPDTVVEESNLSVHISALRRALGDSAAEPAYIETVSRRGYRFIATVADAPLDPPPPPAATKTRFTLLALVGAVALAAVYWSFGRPRTEAVWNPVPLTTTPGLESSPAFSPDGTMVVYSMLSPRSENGLWLQKLDNGTSGASVPVRLTHEYDYNAAWSPDGKEIAYIRESGGLVHLRVRQAFGTADRILQTMDFDGPPPGPMLHYTPDGEWILTSSGTGMPSGAPPRRLVAISARTGELRNLLDPVSANTGDSAPVLSPKGDKLAFCRCATISSCDLYVVPIRQLTPSGPPVRLSDSPSPEFRPVFLNDGSLIHPLGPTDARTLWRTSFDAFGRPHAMSISPVGEDLSHPAAVYTKEGKLRLAYARNMIDPNIWKIDLDRPDGEPIAIAPLIASTRSDESPAYSPDGSRIAFSSTRSGQWEIWTCNKEGKDCVQLTHMGPAFSHYPSWSPDGKWIAFDSRPTSNAHLYLIPASGGPARKLTAGDHSNILPVWSPDGKWLYFASNRSGRYEVYRSPAPNSPASQLTPEPVTTAGGTAPSLSPDGRTFTFRGADGSYHRRTEPDPALHKIQNLRLAFPPTLGPGAIAYGYVVENNKGFIGRLDLVANTARFLHPTDLTRAVGISRSPDGRQILYVMNDRMETDLMIMDIDPPH